MTPTEVLLLAVGGLLAVLALVALRFPRGRRDWPLDARQTAWALASGLTAVAVFVLLYLATRESVWPSLTTTLFAGASLGLGLLVAASLLLPEGLRSRP